MGGAFVTAGAHLTPAALPPGSFEREMLRFLETSIASRSGAGRLGGGPSSGGARARRAAARAVASGGTPRSLDASFNGGGGSPAGPGGLWASRTHLTRVPSPNPTRAHPLAGLWRGDPPLAAAGGAGGVEGPAGAGAAAAHPPPHIISLAYSFLGPAARLVATIQVGGRALLPGYTTLPPGTVAWSASAAPCFEPLPPKEAALVNMRWLLVAGGGGDDHLRGGAAPARPGPPPPRAVAAVHFAKAALPPFQNERADPLPRWIEARLWRYEDGGLGLLYLDTQGLPDLLLEWERVRL